MLKAVFCSCKFRYTIIPSRVCACAPRWLLQHLLSHLDKKYNRFSMYLHPLLYHVKVSFTSPSLPAGPRFTSESTIPLGDPSIVIFTCIQSESEGTISIPSPHAHLNMRPGTHIYRTITSKFPRPLWVLASPHYPMHCLTNACVLWYWLINSRRE